jgi:uncharacterized protein YjbI with pentapeptide repeats
LALLLVHFAIAALLGLVATLSAYAQDCPTSSSPALGIDFSGQNLTFVNFSHQDLTNANFAGATLTGAVFTYANLTGANFRNATIADSNNTNLPTDFSFANLTEIGRGP